MRKIKIKRPVEDINKNCGYAIFIGEDKLGELKNGEEITIKVI